MNLVFFQLSIGEKSYLDTTCLVQEFAAVRTWIQDNGGSDIQEPRKLSYNRSSLCWRHAIMAEDTTHAWQLLRKSYEGKKPMSFIIHAEIQTSVNIGGQLELPL